MMMSGDDDVHSGVCLHVSVHTVCVCVRACVHAFVWFCVEHQKIALLFCY